MELFQRVNKGLRTSPPFSEVGKANRLFYLPVVKLSIPIEYFPSDYLPATYRPARSSHLSEKYKFDEVDTFAELQHGFDRDLSMQAIVVAITQAYTHVGVVAEQNA